MCQVLNGVDKQRNKDSFLPLAVIDTHPEAGYLITFVLKSYNSGWKTAELCVGVEGSRMGLTRHIYKRHLLQS